MQKIPFSSFLSRPFELQPTGCFELLKMGLFLGLNLLHFKSGLARLLRLNFRSAASNICKGWALLILLLTFGGCSQEKNTWTSLAWHNTLAHYNGYFIAREKVKEFEAEQWASAKDNYNKILEVYPFPPLGSGAAANATMDEVIKKASIPVQRHKNSKWLDDSYFLIGKARFYKEDWENAIQTFKYINTKFKDPEVKHKAVIWLLNTYTRMGDFSNAKSVIAFLKKETLSKENLREGAMAFAYYYQKRKDYRKMLDYLSMAVELTPRSKRKGRLSFALGQLNQKFERDADAVKAYRTVFKCWPSFELEFFTRLNLAQVVEITNEKEIAAIRKNFKKMTREPKYEEYYDRIYYEMGVFEIKQKNLPLGLEYLRTSLKQTRSNGKQKPYTYLKLAEIHYKPLRSYVWAKNYYDSTVAGLDTADDRYRFVARRQKILEEFVKHYSTVLREDSLLKLASLDTTKLFSMLDARIKKEQEEKEKAEKKAREQADALANGSDGDALNNSAFDNLNNNRPGGAQTGSGEWYFSNPVAVANGRTEFRKKWGNRKLEDNWRRSSKESELDEGDNQNPDSTQKQDPKGGDLAGGDSKKHTDSEKKGKEEKPSQAQLRQALLKDIPFDETARKASHDKIMVALFEMGKIYDQKLEEPDLAIEALERDVKDYPDYEKAPEAHYNLCMLYRKKSDDPNFNKHKEILLARHAESVFAKLIVNPNYLIENKQRNEIISGLYRDVFDQYKRSMFIEASNGIASIRSQFPKSDFEDKLAMLDALITAKTVDIPSYKSALQAFIRQYPKSDLQEFAKKCLENAQKGVVGIPEPGATMSPGVANSDSSGPAFKTGLNAKQVFLALIPSLQVPEQQLKVAFSDFNQKFYPGDGLEITTLPFGDNKHVMLKIQDLPSKIQAMYYLKKVEESGPFLSKEFKALKPILLLATRENLQLLYKSKALKEYTKFYKQNYNLKKELDDDTPDFGK